MKYLITIKRQNNPNSESYIQKFEVEVYGHVSVATMLKDLNEQQNADISWECGCMSRKCGACAMRINGKPMLACACFADEIRGRKITIEPLSKFPVVRDLIVDRTAGSVNAYRILSQEQNIEHKDQLNVKYKERFYEGCGKSLSCHDICPAGIEVDELTARSNAVAVWKR